MDEYRITELITEIRSLQLLMALTNRSRWVCNPSPDTAGLQTRREQEVESMNLHLLNS